MIERIRQILATRALSPTQFADTIGIGRPVVSHILNGRNKPSLEVMQKIMEAFPDLSLPWLLKGEGPMLASTPAATTVADTVNAIPAPVVSPSKKKPRTTAPTPLQSPSEAVKPEKEPIGPLPQQISVSKREENTPTESVPNTPEPLAAPVAQAPLTAASLPAALAAAPTDKAIRRIIIFYQDGTFTDYQPEK